MFYPYACFNARLCFKFIIRMLGHQFVVKNSRVWHPNTQMSEWSGFDKITNAKGMYLYDSRGRKYIDGVASMWCNVWGHSKSELVSAIKTQSSKLQHSPMFNLTNEPTELLAKLLVNQSPGMSHVFFSDNGSTSMEIAAKMAMQYWSNIGEPRTKIASLKGGYHGDTFGSMSLGYVPDFFAPYKTKLFDVMQLPSPDTYRTAGLGIEGNLHACLDKIEKSISKNSDSMAALVMESGAQMAAGARIYPPKFQRDVSKICSRHNVLLVLDEVATGFGRLGRPHSKKADRICCLPHPTSRNENESVKSIWNCPFSMDKSLPFNAHASKKSPMLGNCVSPIMYFSYSHVLSLCML